MEKCFRCEESNKRLYDAISKKGIVKICRECNIKENLPIIKKMNISEPPEKKRTVYERLSNMTKINPKEREIKTKIKELEKKDEGLKKIVEKNFKEKLKTGSFEKDISGKSNMIRNFHWLIMRERRTKHITQKQLAEAISEPELAIKMAEKGILPRERERLIQKIENYLKIKISKTPLIYSAIPIQDNKIETDEQNSKIEKALQREKISSNSLNENITIGDLIRMKNKAEEKRDKDK